MIRQLPRLVLITRATPLDEFLERFGTRGQVEFFLRSQGHTLEPYQRAHDDFSSALSQVLDSIPVDQRRVRVDRNDLDRFVFAPDDIVVVVGQDGLVANVAKYLDQQLVIGVNSNPDRFDGVLCRHAPTDVAELLRSLVDGHGHVVLEHRSMARAVREDGQELVALNEIFVGHRTHQSARYRLSVRGQQERQSSSGLIIATGTGATGWARSIARQRGISTLPRPEEPRLAWFVREPFPSIATGTELDHGVISPGEAIEISSEMGTGGVLFADGIESDWVDFLDGHKLSVRLATRTLHLISEFEAELEGSQFEGLRSKAAPSQPRGTWIEDAA
ncbi:MAG: hypothetical protein AAF581_17005 [Planctomycetota bacterium]